MKGELPAQERRQAAECFRMFLAEKVSCDHVLEEFGGSRDPDIREIIGLIEEETARAGRYSPAAGREKAFKERVDKALRRLDPP